MRASPCGAIRNQVSVISSRPFARIFIAENTSTIRRRSSRVSGQTPHAESPRGQKAESDDCVCDGANESREIGIPPAGRAGRCLLDGGRPSTGSSHSFSLRQHRFPWRHPTNNQLGDRVVPSVVVRDLLLRQLLRVAHHFIGRDDRSAAGPFRRWQPPLQTWPISGCEQVQQNRPCRLVGEAHLFGLCKHLPNGRE